MGTHVRERERHVREFVMVDQARLRERIEATIEAMIAMLDELEGDPDLEPDTHDEPDVDAEPSLGALEPSVCASQEHWAQGDTHHGADLEDEHDGLEPDADEEPALGSTERGRLCTSTRPRPTSLDKNRNRGTSHDRGFVT